jgi:hypothetical protein
MDTDNTPGVIIADAMEAAGLLAEGATPTADQQTRYLRKLRDLVRWEQTQGLKLFLNQDVAVPLVAGKATYVLSATGDVVFVDKPLRVIQAYYLDANNTRRPLVPLSWDDWIRLAQVVQTGATNSYFVDKQAYQLNLSLWLVPDALAATGTVHLLLQTAVTAPIDLVTTTAFPEEWRTYLVWALADQIATGQPETIMARCQQKAEFYRQSLEDWDVEDASTQFQPDSRLQYVSNNFR